MDVQMAQYLHPDSWLFWIEATWGKWRVDRAIGVGKNGGQSDTHPFYLVAPQLSFDHDDRKKLKWKLDENSISRITRYEFKGFWRFYQNGSIKSCSYRSQR